MPAGDAGSGRTTPDRVRAVDRLQPREALFEAAVDLGLARCAGNLRAMRAGRSTCSSFCSRMNRAAPPHGWADGTRRAPTSNKRGTC